MNNKQIWNENGIEKDISFYTKVKLNGDERRDGAEKDMKKKQNEMELK